MKVTVCELNNDMGLLAEQWQKLVEHVAKNGSDLVLLPEMPFYTWLAGSREVDGDLWQTAVQAHNSWIKRFDELTPATVAGTRPIIKEGKRLNEAFVWTQQGGYQAVHTKYYLPDEPEFWEASWYARGDGRFETIATENGRIGFLICTELWFNAHARTYAKEGIQLLLCPRATPKGTADKWLAGGRTAAVVAGAYCLSSNLGGGQGWIIEPEEGEVLGVTGVERPFLTIEIDLANADTAKQTYPRYVIDSDNQTA